MAVCPSRRMRIRRSTLIVATCLVATSTLITLVHGQERVATTTTTTTEQECAANEDQGDCKANAKSSVFDALGDPHQSIKKLIFSQDSVEKDDVSDPFPEIRRPSSSTKQDDAGALASIAKSIRDVAYGDQASSTSTLDAMLATARNLTISNGKKRSLNESVSLFMDAFGQVKDSLNRSFGDIGVDKLNLASVWYYMEREDEVKNPSWKRRKHRYQKSLETDTAIELHDALYLSQLTYVDSIEEVRAGLKSFANNTWELVFCSTEGLPKEPARFMAIRKESKDLIKKGFFPWKKEDKVLDVLLAVRGTKSIGDVLSDGLLDPVDYRGGKAHAGIAEAGKFLFDKHIDTLKHLLEEFGLSRIRLSLVGHSLGAGAAAIAAIEFNEYPKIEASSIGLGCPSLLSLDLSESTKNFITTVVSDSDIIPRMSGASIANMLLDIMTYDWTAKGLEDLNDFLVFLNASVPFVDIPVNNITKWAEDEAHKKIQPTFANVTKERLSPVLFPPGTCIHVFRDGVGYSGSYMPCDFFGVADAARTFIEDHLVIPGYHRALLTMLRDRQSNFDFEFSHDINAIPC